MSVGSLLCRLTRVVVPAHIVPLMLILIYAVPGVFGLFAFQDRYATLFLSCMALSIIAYYMGYWGTKWVEPRLGVFSTSKNSQARARRFEIASLAVVAAYLLLVSYLALTAERVALFAALGLGDADDITLAREAFVQSRTGAERVLVYVHTITFRAVLPVVIVFLYMRRYRWRHAILGLLLLTSLLSLEKSLSLFLLLPLLTYFLLANRADVAGRLLLLAAAALGVVTVLAMGTLGEFSDGGGAKSVQLVTDSPGDRKNLFWVISAMPGASRPEPRETSETSKELDLPAHEAAAAWAALRLRNRLLNGAMQIDRVSNGAVLLLDHSDKVLDHWWSTVSVGGKLAYQQVADAPPDFSRSIKVVVAEAYVPAAPEAFELRQAVEGFKVPDLAFGTADAKSISLSFWVKASIPGTYNLTIGNGGFTRCYLTTYSVAASDKWEHKTVTVLGDTHGGAKLWPIHSADSIFVNFNFGAGTAYQSSVVNTWQYGFFRQSSRDVVSLVENQAAVLQITGVQLEAGPNAGPFEHRPYATELESSALFDPRHTSDTWRTDLLLRRVSFMFNRLFWMPYITGYDWFRYQDEGLEGQYLHGKTAGPLAWLQGKERFPAEKVIFKYQFGYGATPTGTANAVFFADAYLNFGWLGVFVSSLLLGVIFRFITASGSLPVAAVTVMSSFGVMVASFTANLLSGGLLVLLLLAFVSRGIGTPVAET